MMNMGWLWNNSTAGANLRWSFSITNLAPFTFVGMSQHKLDLKQPRCWHVLLQDKLSYCTRPAATTRAFVDGDSPTPNFFSFWRRSAASRKNGKISYDKEVIGRSETIFRICDMELCKELSFKRSPKLRYVQIIPPFKRIATLFLTRKLKYVIGPKRLLLNCVLTIAPKTCRIGNAAMAVNPSVCEAGISNLGQWWAAKGVSRRFL